MAKAYLKCLEINPVDFEWKDKSNWLAFELACIEAMVKTVTCLPMLGSEFFAIMVH